MKKLLIFLMLVLLLMPLVSARTVFLNFKIMDLNEGYQLVSDAVERIHVKVIRGEDEVVCNYDFVEGAWGRGDTIKSPWACDLEAGDYKVRLSRGYEYGVDSFRSCVEARCLLNKGCGLGKIKEDAEFYGLGSVSGVGYSTCLDGTPWKEDCEKKGAGGYVVFCHKGWELSNVRGKAVKDKHYLCEETIYDTVLKKGLCCENAGLVMDKPIECTASYFNEIEIPFKIE